MMAWILANKAMILGVALGLSETLAMIPQVQANSIFQSVVNGIKFLAGK